MLDALDKSWYLTLLLKEPPEDLLCCLEPSPDNLDCFCEDIAEFISPATRRAGRAIPKVIYPDGRSQKVTPAFLEANSFVEQAQQFAGMNSIHLNANGILWQIIKDKPI